MAEHPKRLVDTFTTHVMADFKHYLEEYGHNDLVEEFITYLIDFNIIDPLTIKRYAILKDYDLLLATGEHKKTAVLKKISRKYNLSERSLWDVIGSKSTRERFFRNLEG